MNKEEFLNQIPESNSEWCSQQLLFNCTQSEIWAIQKAFEDFKKVCFKSWVQQMTFDEIETAICRAAILQKEK